MTTTVTDEVETSDGSDEVCIVPASGDIWPFYQRHGVFVTQANKFFRDVPRFAFYTSRLVRPLAPCVLQTVDDVKVEDTVIAGLTLSVDPVRRRVGMALAAVAENLTSDDPVKVIVLTTVGDVRTANFGEVEHHARGPWVRTRRYVPLRQLMAAQTTYDIDGGGEA